MEQEHIQEAIIERFNNLQPEIQEIIINTNYDETLYDISKRYNLTDEQYREIELNTTLVLLGNTHPDKYKDELLEDLKIPENEVDSIIFEIKEKILNKVLPIIINNFKEDEELEKRIVGEVEKEATILTSKPLVLDPKFASIPKAVQEAVALSGWKEKLYEIARKYSLTVDKMGVLEDITTKTIVGSIKADEFENEIRLKIDLPEDKLKEMISEINTA
ncbi:hypothetical protein M0R04_16405, partial [Candidatus Dojkabacteria bacterium]|nr:hypothetical protein [Candidatus Dojkabacteria bacterium]